MKKIFAICILTSIVSISDAQTCPPANDVFVKKDGKIEVVTPPGWKIKIDHRSTSTSLSFSVAAWGDHNHDTDPVRCHYYNGYQDHVQLNTVYMLNESQITSHPEWSGDIDGHYHLCTNAGDVNACPFN